jgi:hypothetical protein
MDNWDLLTTTRSTRRGLLFITGAVAAGQARPASPAAHDRRNVAEAE